MHISTLFAFLIASTLVLTAPLPLPQGAGVGAGCDPILTDADTGSGLAVKETGQNAASLPTSAGAKLRLRLKRQDAGVGSACNSILTDGDTGSGLAVKKAGQNAASLMKSLGVRQLDKAGAGTAAVISVVDPEVGSYQEGITNVVDGDGTDDSSIIGQQIGVIEAQAGAGAGNIVPSKLPAGKRSKRQLDKAGAGTAAIISVVSPEAGAYQEGITNVVDGDGTDDSAVIGQQIGAIEAQVGEGAGNLVPSKVPKAA